MARAYTTDRAPGSEMLEQHRRSERQRLFERLVMLPVSLGMVTAFIALAVSQALVGLDGPSWISEKLAATPVIAAAGAFALAVARWKRG